MADEGMNTLIAVQLMTEKKARVTWGERVYVEVRDVASVWQVIGSGKTFLEAAIEARCWWSLPQVEAR